MRLSSAGVSRTLFVLVSLLCCARAVAPRPLNSAPRRVSRRKRNDEYAAGQSQATATTSPDFTVHVDPSAISVNVTGDDAGGTLTVTGTNGFSGTVDLSCDITPVMVNPPFCFVFGEQVNVDSANAPSTVMFFIGAIPPSCMDIYAEAAPGNFGGERRVPAELEASLLALALLVSFTRLVAVRHRTRVLSSAFICAALMMAGCASSNNSGFQCSTGVPNAGTPAGAYTITITATSGNISHTATVPLTVTSPF